MSFHTISEKGQGLVEYALIVVLIAIVVIIVLTIMGSDISSVLAALACAFDIWINGCAAPH